jgi:hypothetical protein
LAAAGFLAGESVGREPRKVAAPLRVRSGKPGEAVGQKPGLQAESLAPHFYFPGRSSSDNCGGTIFAARAFLSK